MARYYTRKKLAREAAAAVQPINFAQRDELTLRESRRR
jgi:hypothetical protein